MSASCNLQSIIMQSGSVTEHDFKNWLKEKKPGITISDSMIAEAFKQLQASHAKSAVTYSLLKRSKEGEPVRNENQYKRTMAFYAFLERIENIQGVAEIPESRYCKIQRN